MIPLARWSAGWLFAAPILILVAVVLLALGVGLGRRQAASAPGVNAVGRLGTVHTPVAANFTLPALDGSEVQLSSLLGQGVVLNFWASWCVPCREEAPTLAKAARDYRPLGVTFVGVAVWELESEANSFVARYGIDYPSGIDAGGRIAIEYGVTGIPETYFIRPDGTIVRRWIGPISDRDLRSFLEEIRPVS